MRKPCFSSSAATLFRPPYSDENSTQRVSFRAWRRCGVLLLCTSLGLGTLASSQNTAATTADPSKITRLLDETISWYRLVAVEQLIATDSADLPVVSDNRQNAEGVVRLAFEFARAATTLMAQKGDSQSAEGEGSAEYRALMQLQSKLDRQIHEIQTELEANKQKLSAAPASQKSALDMQVSELQGELDLANVRRDAVRSMVEFVSGASANGLGATGLRAQIETFAGAVSLPTGPSASSSSGSGNSAALTARVAAAEKSDSASLWDMTGELLGLSKKISKIETLIGLTTALVQTSRDTAAPLVSELKGLSRMGDALAEEADTANPSQLAQERQQLDALADRFKQVSAAVIPLSKQTVLLSLYQRNLARWRDASQNQYHDLMRKLAIRAGILALVLALVIAAAELWKRAVYRYIHEPRRRYQFLLLRRFVLWFVIVLVIAFAFASRLDSLVTFAGLITAGVAVALQNVILSIVGYFFLIGRYGIRVGDRVKIGEVTGEVIDVGLVRLHLMELSDGAEGPTGRVVAFSNSIVFQASGGLFKQIPGLNFAWHEISLTFAADTPLGGLKERLLKAVETVLADYHEEIERQNQEIAEPRFRHPPIGCSLKSGCALSPRGWTPPFSIRSICTMPPRSMNGFRTKCAIP